MNKKANRKLTYDDQHQMCLQFLRTFDDYKMTADPIYGKKKYLIQLQEIANGERSALQITVEDLELHFNKEEEMEMVAGFKFNTKRYESIFTDIAGKLMPKRSKIQQADDEIKEKYERILEEHRKDNLETQMTEVLDPRQKIPIASHQNYDVTIYYGNESKVKYKNITQLTSDDIGSLVVLKGIVVRTSIVKPEIIVATYGCDVCGCQNYQVIHDASYRPLTQCMSKKCIQNKVTGKLTFLAGHSKFKSFQEIKIQQTSDQLKQGAIPKLMTVYLRGSRVDQASAGDIILLQGVMLPTRRLGFRYANLLAFDAHIEAHHILRQRKRYVDIAMAQQVVDKIYHERSQIKENDIFDKLARSIAPEIFGMDFVKKALLLQLIGGVTKTTHDNVRVRGQINIALIGDPGIAKSQLLKHISHLAPRAVYTTGKGSSGVGLTAAIVLDPVTKDIYLQAGALVLADMGICCIDEFDKMDENDRTAIHEVMEQQSVSIAKSGITATLNARTAVLAAANPVYGRYDRKQTAHNNINLPPALLSRFDLIFILLDNADQMRDFELALHIGKVHQNKKSPNEDVFDSEFVRTYVALAKQFKPTISAPLHRELVNKYIEKRRQQADVSREGQNYITTRSLLALIRLCNARAKLRFSNQVNSDDLQDCLEILEESQKSIVPQKKEFKPKIDFLSQIFKIIRDNCTYNQEKVQDLNVIQEKVKSRGWNQQEFRMTLKNYENLNVIIIEDNSRVRILV